MWYAAVVMCGLSGPAPCLIRIEEVPHVVREQCVSYVHAIARFHNLPSGALRSKQALEGSASARNLGALPFFNLGCVAYTQKDASEGIPLIEKVAKTLGPRAGAEL